jgi:hypothetical protein
LAIHGLGFSLPAAHAVKPFGKTALPDESRFEAGDLPVQPAATAISAGVPFARSSGCVDALDAVLIRVSGSEGVQVSGFKARKRPGVVG